MTPPLFDLESDESQAEMVALVVHEESLCSGCGQPIGQTTNSNDTWLIEDAQCGACWAQAQVVEMHRKRAGDHPEALAGLRVWPKGKKRKEA